jgi:hypothetical protein
MVSVKDAVNGISGTLYIDPETGEASDQHL